MTPVTKKERPEAVKHGGGILDEFWRETLRSGDKAVRNESERVHHFLSVPRDLEKFIVFGVSICLEWFLEVFTIWPFRILFATGAAVKGAFRGGGMSSLQRIDVCKALLLFCCCYALHYVDAARVYHSVRGQSVIKLYVIVNVLEICDKLCSAFGQDILDTFYAHLAKRSAKSIFYFSVALLYLFLHSIVLFYQVMSLNVAINSHNNSLLTLLLSNQFVEIKGAVFKKFEKENLFQLACSDIVERFQLSIFLALIFMRNYVELYSSVFVLPGSITQFIAQLIQPIVIVYVSEVLVDWLKHAFIARFNGLNRACYAGFLDSLGRSRASTEEDILVKRIGFVGMPLACLVIRVCVQTGRMAGWELNGESAVWAVVVFTSALTFKLSLSVFLGRIDAKKSSKLNVWQSGDLLDESVHKKRQKGDIDTIERFKMVRSRIV